jgi:hypothetical protein
VLQGKPAYVYSEEQCCSLIQAGAKRGDVPFIELVWERLCRDVKRPGREQETPAGVQSIIASFAGAASSSAAADSADAGAAGTNSGGSSSSSQQSLATAAAAAGGGAATEADPARQASANAHLAVIQALVQCDAFDKAFSYIHDMEQVYGQDPACSVYHGLRFFPESLGTEAKLAAAFAKLQKRKVRWAVCVGRGGAGVKPTL